MLGVDLLEGHSINCNAMQLKAHAKALRDLFKQLEAVTETQSNDAKDYEPLKASIVTARTAAIRDCNMIKGMLAGKRREIVLDAKNSGAKKAKGKAKSKPAEA